MNLDQNQTLFTFDSSFPWYLLVNPPSPTYASMDVMEMWVRWGHGTEVTVYTDEVVMYR